MHRKFFEKFARKEGFDPLVPTSWYTVMRSELLEVKVGGERDGGEGCREREGEQIREGG